MRLNKFLASCGVGSRRACDALISAGRVRVNGAPVSALATFVEPGRDTVAVDGRRVTLPAASTYYLLHKPEGVVTTVRDPQGRAKVLDFVPRTPRVFPVGRLDYDSSGALLLTDDGDLAHRLLHPRYHLEKEYEVTAQGTVSLETAYQLARGILLPEDRRPTAPAEVKVLERKPRRTRLRMVLREGRNRQIRRMLEAVGHPVVQLRRVRIGPIELGDLEPGSFRELDRSEVAALRRVVERKPKRKPREG